VAVRYAKYRLPDGRQVKKKLGPAWTERGRPPTGYFTKRLAEDWLRSALDQARRGTLPGMVRTGATFADAAAEYLRYIEHDRGRKPSTVRGYRSAIEAHLLAVFGAMPVEDVTTEAIERWMTGFVGSPRSRNKLLIQLHGILGRARKAYGLTSNAAADVEKVPQRRSGDIDVFSPEEIWALVRAADSQQDGAIFRQWTGTGMWRGTFGDVCTLCVECDPLVVGRGVAAVGFDVGSGGSQQPRCSSRHQSRARARSDHGFREQPSALPDHA
jgi:hypothetical protein